MTAEEKVSIELSNAEALILFDFLGRFEEIGVLAFEDDGEKWALNDLFCSLEKVLDEPFAPDCDELLRKARELVRDGRNW